MEDIILKVENVSKQYRLGVIGGTTLREELQRRHAKRRGLEDPTQRIGARTYESGETFPALDNVSFEVKRGERVGIIGRNGAGKSTLLKLISRVTAPTSGEIGLNGRVSSMLEVGTGFHRELTGRENIYMNGAILGMTKKEIDEKIEEIIDFSEVRAFIDTPVKRYSSGMYVKLAFAVAANLNSEIIIMDEVLAVGDMAFQKKCISRMNEVSQAEGRTILYVSHNMATVRRLCNRCIVLDRGRLIFDGDVEEAIGVYMETAGEGAAEADLTQRRHVSFKCRLAEMEHIRIEDYNGIAADSADPLTLSLRIRALEDFRDAMFRIIIVASDGTPVGSAWSGETVSAAKGQVVECRFSADISALVTGRYYLSISLSSIRPDGRIENFDGVVEALCFDVQNDHLRVNWRPTAGGHIALPDLKRID